MRRILASIATSTLALGGLLVATAAPASAHTPHVESTCDSLSIDLRYYAEERQGSANTIEVVVDGETKIDEKFGRSYSTTLTLDPTEAHEWSLEVDARDDRRYDVKKAGTTTPCPTSEPGLETGFYVYPKLDPNKPAAWTNSGFQTLITTRDGGEFWDTLPEEYPGPIFDPEELPGDVCEGSWGVQQDVVRMVPGHDWADYQHIEFRKGGPMFKSLKAARHDELSNYLPQCNPSQAEEVTLPAPAPVEQCDAQSSVTMPETDLAVYTEEWNDSRTEVTVTAEPNDGVRLAPDAQTEWTFQFAGEACEPTIVTPEAPQVTDQCGVQDDGLTVPADTEQVTYTSTDEGILAHAAEATTFGDLPEGYTAVDDTTALFAVDESTFSDEPCALVPGDITAVCESEVPYLAYEVSLPEGVEADGDTPLTVTFLNPDGDDYTVTDQPLAGSLLWPGASAQEPLQWPGWEQLDDGSYVETDGNYAWTRDGVQVLFEVNPDYSTVVDYPQASSECANPELPDAGVGGVDPVVDAEPVADASVDAAAEELPQTGATVGIVAALAALLVAAGVTLFVVRRRVRQE